MNVHNFQKTCNLLNLISDIYLFTAVFIYSHDSWTATSHLQQSKWSNDQYQVLQQWYKITDYINFYYSISFLAELQVRSRSRSSHVSLVSSMYSSLNVWHGPYCRQLQNQHWSFQYLVSASLDSIRPTKHTLCIISIPTEVHQIFSYFHRKNV